MKNLIATLHRQRNERGASAVEYGMLIAGIAGVVVLVIFLFGAQVESLFSGTCNDLAAHRGVGSC
ncbi:MAG: Flp family type IVb pilin [Nocardioides sp.]